MRFNWRLNMRLTTQLILAMLLVALVSVGITLWFQTRVSGAVRDVLPKIMAEHGTPLPRPNPNGPRNEDRRVMVDRAYTVYQAEMQRANLLSLLVSAVVCVSLATLLARSIAKPVLGVGRAARAVADGQLSIRASIAQHNSRELKGLIEDFNQMAGRLEQSDLQRKALFADVAHELRTPITALQARLESMQDGLVLLDVGQLNRLHNQVDQLARLVEDVRTLSLAEAGQLRLQRKSIQLEPWLSEIIEQIAPLARRNQVQLNSKLETPNMVVQWDDTRVLQIIGNLLDNALHATPNGGSIEVGSSAQGGAVQIQIRDSGPGFTAEAKAQAFNRFFKTDTSTGSGIGLAIVKTLCEAHGGTVQLENGHPGAVFTVILPMGTGVPGSIKT
jgi:two-component system, OmpR family, sensor histidine kinase BaeS